MQNIRVLLYKKVKEGPTEYLGTPNGIEHEVPLEMALRWVQAKIAKPTKKNVKFFESLLKK